MWYEKACEAADFIRSRQSKEIRVVVVLGSGLGSFAESIGNPVSIPYGEIPHFSRSTVEGHAGRLVLGEVAGIPVAVQQGRFHYYEGYGMEEIMLPMRAFGRLGVKTAVLTNAAGSLRTSFKPGSLMLIRDHINMMGANPLRGSNDDRFGPRFPDMTEVYDREFQNLVYNEALAMAREKAAATGQTFQRFMSRGVYCALSGPTYETPAEIRMFRFLGADAVGMSTVPEAIAARHQGMKVLGISCITNLAAGMTDETINHEEVMDIGSRAAETFGELLRRVIARL